MRVAVVGSGVTGLGAAWALNEHSAHDVVVFEAAARVGGHSNTVRFEPPSGAAACDVDTGFIVFNEVTYPNFLRFLKHLSIPILSSDMSFAVSRSFPSAEASSSPARTKAGGRTGALQRGAFEWAGSSPAALFAQGANLLDPSHWRMIWDIIRFNYQSLDTLRATAQRANAKAGGAGQSIGAWLDERGYGDSFRNNYLIPMTASIWSTPPGLAFSAFPALTLLRFMHNHHLLQLLDRPTWLTIKGGSHNYVQRVVSRLPDGALRLGDAGSVTKVHRDGEEWVVHVGNRSERFDRVIFACHADTALSLLDGSADPDASAALANFKFSENEAVLHADERLMPVRRIAWSAWNFLATSKSRRSTDEDRVTLTYWMNLLQSLPEEKHGHVLVTLNPAPGAEPREHLVRGRFKYTHPLYTPDSVAAQARLRTLQGRHGAYYAGAWTAYGFHEDGFSSGLRAACALGADVPFKPQPAERPLPAASPLAWLLITAFEALRRRVAPWLALFIAPTIIVLALLIELASAPACLVIPALARSPRLQEVREVRRWWVEEVQGKWL